MIDPALILLLLAAFAAGFIDAVIGGGGLIQLPALMFYMPQAPLPVAFGTSKLAGFTGTVWAAVKYSRKTKLKLMALIPAILTALPAAYIGAQAVTQINKEALKPLIIVLFSVVAIYTFLKKDFGIAQPKNLSKVSMLLLALLTGLIIGFYDGFFGPGTGSFLVFIYVFLFGFDFLHASANAKIINCVTNLAALYFFIKNGHISFSVAIPVAICNMTGSVVGTHLALKKGSAFIRKAFLLVICSFITKMIYDVCIIK